MVSPMPELDLAHRRTRQEILDGLPDDDDGGETDEPAFEDRAEELHLAVAVGVAAVGWTAGEEQDAHRKHRGHHVGDRLESVRQDRSRPGHPIRQPLHGEQHGADRQRQQPGAQAEAIVWRPAPRGGLDRHASGCSKGGVPPATR